MVQERLKELRAVMRREKIDCYVIPTSDFHGSEYVSEYFMVRRYFSGFTGSAGTLVVLADKAVLFTDGRYFIQAAKELAGSGITLMKTGEAGVPSLTEYVKEELKEGQTIGFDGRVLTAENGFSFEKIAEQKKGKLVFHLDLAQKIWKDRPHLPETALYLLDEEYSGESSGSKIKRLREKMLEEGVQIHILTTLDDIAWLFNLRGNDVENCPVFLSYVLITQEEVILFAGKAAFNESIRSYLFQNHILLKHYNDFYAYVTEFVKTNKEEKILICEDNISYLLRKKLGEMKVINKPNPTALMKAVKNRTEQENLRKAHLMDGIAVTKFMYWLKKNVGEIPMTEISAAAYLRKLRDVNPSFLEPSFPTICAYASNGAVIHYSALEKSCAQIKPEGMLMVDSGGHYWEGSTDITRTFVLGKITNEMKLHFTLVVRAMLRLKSARFLYGTKGVNLDILARGILWEKGLDYKHGTGHGVGYLLNVHEGPNSFRHKMLSGEDGWCFEEGMVTTDEPGIYVEGSHGVRIENELLCHTGETNEYGRFMYFEDLTYVPIDLDGIDKAVMEQKEIDILNHYHKEVYEKLSPFFEGEELDFLMHATRAI